MILQCMTGQSYCLENVLLQR